MTDEKRDKKPDDVPDQTSTEQLSGSACGGPSPTPPGVYLMIHYRCGGPETAHLAPGQPLVVGRRQPATVCIPDKALSAAHARFTLLENGVLVEDLGSKNGSWVSGKRIEREVIELSGEVMLSEMVIVRVFALGMVVNPSVESSLAFRRHLDEELKNAEALSRRPFTILAVRANDAEVTAALNGTWAMSLRSYLQSTDPVSLDTPQLALVLLRAKDHDAAFHVARKIAVNEIHPSRPRLVGVAVYPKAAATADKLITLAIEEANRAKPEQPVVFASMAPWTDPSSSTDDTTLIAGARMRNVIHDLERVAKSRIPVLLLGETGTGKEELAKYLHKIGPRKLKKFIAVNCGAIPENLVESTFFGHEKGSFTGALERQGCFKAADRGTLFLDEIGDLPRDAQVKLLRVLQDGRFSVLGSPAETQVDVRIIAATNQDLQAMMKEGRFREDLWYRLKVMVVKIPPLRERPDEIERLCELFVEKANMADGRADGQNVRGLSEEAMTLMRTHRWPGNVRELQNAIERAVAVAQGDLIQPEDLPQDVYDAQSDPHDALDGGLKAEAESQKKQHEKPKILAALQETGGNQRAAAKKLKISYETLRRRIKEYGIEVPKKR